MRKNGFTLVEIMVVMAIIFIFAAMIIPAELAARASRSFANKLGLEYVSKSGGPIFYNDSTREVFDIENGEIKASLGFIPKRMGIEEWKSKDNAALMKAALVSKNHPQSPAREGPVVEAAKPKAKKEWPDIRYIRYHASENGVLDLGCNVDREIVAIVLNGKRLYHVDPEPATRPTVTPINTALQDNDKYKYIEETLKRGIDESRNR
jgi:prepilin-type N-terminal cleavage/methylation domain-containing protein